MAKTLHTIRIVDARQSKRPHIIRPIALTILGPGALMWPGALLGSAAMQWAGFILFLVLIFKFTTQWTDDFCTPDGARKKIDELEELNEAGPKPLKPI